MLETRKYMDYELALKGYQDVNSLLHKVGINEIKKRFCLMCGYHSDDKEVNFYYEDYNTWITIVCYENAWYVSTLVEIMSYGGDEDTIRIDNRTQIQDRLDHLLEWATEHHYSRNDYKSEKKSLESVLRYINKRDDKAIEKYMEMER